MKKTMLILIILFNATVISNSSFADSVSTIVRCSQNSAEETLVTIHPIPQSLESISSDNSQLFVSFDKSHNVIQTTSAPIDCYGTLSDIDLQDNSLTIQVTPGKKITLTDSNNSFLVGIEKTKNDNVAATSLLSSARANLLFEEKAVKESFLILEEELKKHPEDVDLMIQYASYEAALDRKRSALKYIEKATSIDPSRHDIDLEGNKITSSLLPYIGADTEYVDGEDEFNQVKSKIKTRTLIDSNSIAGDFIDLEAAFNNSEFDAVREKTGDISSIDVEQEQFHLAYGHPFGDENEFISSVDEGSGELGWGLELKSIDRDGSWHLGFLVHKPDWSYASTIAFDGVKDSLFISRDNQHFAPDLTGSLGIYLHRYSLLGSADAARSLATLGNLSYILISNDPVLSLNYRLDAEYFLVQQEYTTAFGESFRYLGTESHEYHVFSLGVHHAVLEFPDPASQMDLGAFGGYAIDRLGDRAPEVGASVRLYGPKGPEIKSDVGRTFSTVKNASTQTKVMFGLLWRY